MKIAGLQKTSLIDFPGHIACTIFLHGCNFRCGFCYNPDLVINECEKYFSNEEILDFLQKRRDILDAVCITGGEPLATLNIDFLKKIKHLNYLIKLDTNGSFSEKLRQIINENLVDYIAMDIKGSKDNYQKITKTNLNMEDIENSIKSIFNFGSYEFRTTVVPQFHDKENIKKMCEWLNQVCGAKPKKFVLQGFQNGHDFIDNNFKKIPSTNEQFLNELKDISKDYFGEVKIRI